ncbi:tryptophan 7-halogenase [Massilia arenosa]|uniref:Tryptophan 7-halogenase n=1 Tax=Zemynaea arenosa TaxID=2561931 RepID=A0A4Y9S6S9_9BURK|nr:tryptophan halogenase family protein [Massilia arenosa]TFW15741.1 tryptophan 7-halogenase [Massilia arenosa]
MSPSALPKRILIVGGGSAGWMTALMYGDALIKKGVEITVVESPNVGTIGVGEGSTALLKRYFDELGIVESEWMPECHATYKAGISFPNWSTRPGYESYMHPFWSMLDHVTLPAYIQNVHARQRGVDIDANPDRYFIASKLARQGLAPLPPESFPFHPGYGYHFDAGLLGKYLQKKAMACGVRHKSCHVTEANLDVAGRVASISTMEGETLEADFFIDCSGFSALLIEKALKTPFVSYADVLFNDSAVALPTPIGETIPTVTVSAALSHGWGWKIPLTDRFGNGYVYSSSFISSDAAERELREHAGVGDADVQARHLKMKLGRVAQHWNRNVLAVGLSQGFLEPLEATALYLTQTTAGLFLVYLEKGELGEQAQAAYNREVNGYFDGHRDYIVAHYKTNTRTDTDYWRANAMGLDKISDSLKRIFQTWIEGKDLGAEIRHQGIEHYYPVGSWYALLAGMGTFPQLGADARQPAESLAQIDDFTRRCVLNFRDHRTVLNEQVRMREAA